MKRTGTMRAVATAATLSLALAAPTALAAPGGVPGKPAWAGEGKPSWAGSGKPDIGLPSGASAESTSSENPTINSPGAKGDGKGKGKGQNGPVVMYVFKGIYGGVDTSTMLGTVDVSGGNKHARGFAGEVVTFDLTNAKVSVADVDLDGDADLDDVHVGDEVKLKARLSKRDPGVQPFAAKMLVDETHPELDDDEVEETPVLEEPVTQ